MANLVQKTFNNPHQFCHIGSMAILALTLSLFVTSATVNWKQNLLYQPKTIKSPVKLVTVIHGCFQDSEKIMHSAGWNEWAEKNGALVFYPNQKKGRNPMNCWNWFDPENQRRDSGEPKRIIKEIEALTNKFQIKHSYVAGLSSGAATVSILLACYPEKFQAGLIHSGIAYAAADDALSAASVLKNGPKKNFLRKLQCQPSKYKSGLMLVQGDNDKVVNPLNLKLIISDFLSQTQSARRDFAPTKTKKGYTEKTYTRNGKLIGKAIEVRGMGHAWSGGKPKENFSDPSGPDVTKMAWDFFNQF